MAVPARVGQDGDEGAARAGVELCSDPQPPLPRAAGVTGAARWVPPNRRLDPQSR